ncbi:MAG: hypothetical protein Q8K83_05965 [Methylotenera sp.]|nr:hypothetical protein [Methylotenera sp.]MDP1766432.1 hypothetical protein [Methylotenera sp.]
MTMPTLGIGLYVTIRYGHLRGEDLSLMSLERGAASDGSPTLRAGTLPSCGAAPLQNMSQEALLPLSLQEKPPEFEKFLRELGIAA